MRLAQLALPFRLRAVCVAGGVYRIGVGCLLTALVLHSNEEFVIVAEALIIAANEQIIIGGLRCAALQLQGARVCGSECDSRQAGYVVTTPNPESVLSVCGSG